MFSPRLSGLAALGALTLVLSGCAGEQQVTTGIDSLRLATLGSITPSEQAFLDRLDELSEGDIDVEVTENWTGSGDDTDEIALTKAVLAGDVDIAWVTVRSLSAIGAEDIDVLEAPMLIRTHQQQRAVALGVPGELITSSLRNLGVEGLAILPGPQLYPLASGAPLLDIADWAGKTVQVGASSPAEAAGVEAFGASASTDGDGGAADVVAGSVQVAGADPSQLVAAGVTEEGPFMTSNVSLWPRMSMILINRDVLDRLSSRQNGFLDGSVVRAQDVAMATPDTETIVGEACAAGALFGAATADQLTALTEQAEASYDAYKGDAGSERLLEAIQEVVKRNAGTGAFSVGKACRWVAPD